MSRCIGCGINLQNINKKLIGFTPKLDNKYCERCFKTTHYNEDIKVLNINNTNVLDKINNLGLYTIFISDLLSLNNASMNLFKNIKNQKMLVINKCDLIPNNFKLEHLEENIKNSFQIDCDITFISAKKKMYLNKIIDAITDNQKVIICGETSSGKSTLINELTNSKLTISQYNNTTLDFIKINYLDYLIYDTPGLIINENKYPSNKIVVYTKKLQSDYVLSIDDIKITGEGYVTCVVSDQVKISSKKENNSLKNCQIISNNQDIELNNGFIFVKKGLKIQSNQKLNIRSSIIGR